MWVRKEEGRRKASGFLLLGHPRPLGWSSPALADLRSKAVR